MGWPQSSQVINPARRTPRGVEEEMAAMRPRVPLPVVHPWRVDRTDISFHNTAADRVQIGVTVHNRSSEWSPPTTMLLQSAVLGAFVPWRPLTSLDVPEIEPGGQVHLTTQAHCVRPTVLGCVEDLTSQRVIDALAQAELREQIRQIEQRSLARRHDRRQDRVWPEATMREAPRLSIDLLDVLGRPNVYWAGNLNVFIGAHAVERHCAQALRIYPGRTNWAMFLVGSGTDAYAFDVTGAESDWELALHTGCPGPLVSALNPAHRIVPNRWIAGREVRFVQFVVHPPDGCGQGEVAVHVTQQSTGAEALVEFSLDPQAAGPGCFVM
jgi:hypothetical protein